MHGTMNIKNICKMKREYQPDKDKETRISKKKKDCETESRFYEKLH